MAENYRRKSTATTYGNLAFDLDALARQRQLEEAGIMPERRSARPEPQLRRRVKAQPKLRTNPLLVCGILALGAMVMVLLLCYVQLTTVSTRVSDINAELKVLEAEHVMLLTEYEKTFDLATIKAVAEAAGMSKPSQGQIQYIDLSGSDTVVVHNQAPSRVEQMMASAKSGVLSAVEYFR